MTEIVGGFTAFSQRRDMNNGPRAFAAEDDSGSPRAPKSFDPEKLKEIPGQDRRWSWVEVDLSAIRHNCSQVKHVVRGKHVMAVVKADAYGHGAVQVAKMALNSGADYLGVATIDEAIALREALVNAPILVLSQPPMQAIPLLLAYKVMPSLYTMEFALQYAETADLYGMKAPYHLVVNTGLNCIGVPYDQALGFLSQVDFHRALDLKGVFTHFATAELPDSIDLQRQVTRFVDAVNGMQAAGFDVGLVHCANTAATLRYPQLHFDMVRAGIALYGYHPCFETRSVISLRPAMSVHARITDVRSVSVGESASYGLYYRGAGSASKVCTIPVGYGDGLPRALCDRGHVLYQGQLMNLVGTISMDHSMFEVDLRPRAGRPRLDPQMGDEVVLVGRQGESSITMEELADLSGTVTYERCCGFGMRLPKVYV